MPASFSSARVTFGCRLLPVDRAAMRVERRAADRVDVADDALRERLNVEDDVVGDELFGPIATRAAQARQHVGARFVEREARRDAVPARANGPPSYCGSRFATSSSLRVSARSCTIGRLRSRSCDQRFELAQAPARRSARGRRHDEREPAVAGLVAQKHLEDVPQLRVACLRRRPGRCPRELSDELLLGLDGRLDPARASVLDADASAAAPASSCPRRRARSRTSDWTACSIRLRRASSDAYRIECDANIGLACVGARTDCGSSLYCSRNKATDCSGFLRLTRIRARIGLEMPALPEDGA